MSDFDERTQSLVDEFAKQYGEQPTWIAIGPGRVNLIGEHTEPHGISLRTENPD